MVGVAQAYAGETADAWLVLGGSGAELFEIEPETGAIVVAPGATFEAGAELTLELVAQDECAATAVTLAVRAAPPVEPGEEAPECTPSWLAELGLCEPEALAWLDELERWLDLLLRRG